MFGFLVRLVPELIAFGSPVGFDTVDYAVVMKSGVVWANWGSFFTSSWLLYGLTVPVYAVSGVNPFVLLKLVDAVNKLFNLEAEAQRVSIVQRDTSYVS